MAAGDAWGKGLMSAGSDGLPFGATVGRAAGVRTRSDTCHSDAASGPVDVALDKIGNILLGFAPPPRCGTLRYLGYGHDHIRLEHLLFERVSVPRLTLIVPQLDLLVGSKL